MKVVAVPSSIFLAVNLNFISWPFQVIVGLVSYRVISFPSSYKFFKTMEHMVEKHDLENFTKKMDDNN